MHYKKVTKFFNNNSGFTLTEFLLVLSVIAILATISISVISNSPGKMP